MAVLNILLECAAVGTQQDRAPPQHDAVPCMLTSEQRSPVQHTPSYSCRRLCTDLISTAALYLAHLQLNMGA